MGRAFGAGGLEAAAGVVGRLLGAVGPFRGRPLPGGVGVEHALKGAVAAHAGSGQGEGVAVFVVPARVLRCSFLPFWSDSGRRPAPPAAGRQNGGGAGCSRLAVLAGHSGGMSPGSAAPGC